MNRLSLVRRALPAALTRKVGRQLLVTQKNSPHILFGIGLVGFAGTVVLASRATLRVEDIIKDANKDLANVTSVLNNKGLAEKHSYTEDDALKDRIQIYVRTTVRMTRLYAPALGLGTIAVLALTKSHVTLTQRNAALIAAYANLEKAFSEYRKRVREATDKDTERDLYLDAHPSFAAVENDSGGKVLVPAKVIGPNAYSPYARFFDELSGEWKDEPEYNYLFLRAQQAYMNDLLISRGHVFLNEVYDNLGIPRSRAGAVVGWVVNKDNTGDNYIDFGFMNGNNNRARDFVNGREGAILLDFNVDGIIYDKIRE